jgi:hypothetical protein
VDRHHTRERGVLPDAVDALLEMRFLRILCLSIEAPIDSARASQPQAFMCGLRMSGDVYPGARIPE